MISHVMLAALEVSGQLPQNQTLRWGFEGKEEGAEGRRLLSRPPTPGLTSLQQPWCFDVWDPQATTGPPPNHINTTECRQVPQHSDPEETLENAWMVKERGQAEQTETDNEERSRSQDRSLYLESPERFQKPLCPLWKCRKSKQTLENKKVPWDVPNRVPNKTPASSEGATARTQPCK